MRSRVLSGAPLRTYAVVFEPGDEPVSGLTAFAREAGIDAAHLTAIGAVERVTVGWFDLDARDYRRIELEEQLEVLSLVGDVTDAGDGSGDPKVHAHVVLGRRDGSTAGGHLLEASVRPTLEVLLTETPAELRRRHDPATGLALIDLDRSSGAGSTEPAHGGSDGANSG